MDNKEIKIAKEIERFKKGFPWMKIAAPATPGHGIEVLSEDQQKEACDYADTATTRGRCKFVPASGAATRMFKDIFAGMKEPNDAVKKLAAEIEKFAFYDPEVFKPGGNVAEELLLEGGLGYGNKPKGVLKFHRYPSETRTAFAEHLVEAQDYMRNPDGSVRIICTISEEHRPLFEAALAEVKEKYEKRYGVRYDITFCYQDKSTNTIAVDKDNKPFLTDDGQMLFRPAGHGALIHNLNAVEEELVSIKNIDNVCVERMLPTTAKYKKVLMGRALQLRDKIFGYLTSLHQYGAVQIPQPFGHFPGLNPSEYDPYATEDCQALCMEAENFLARELCIRLPEFKTCRERAEKLIAILDRPIRVCGMVRNQGEPGGGPFIIKEKDGTTSLQILEGAQINPDDPEALAALKSATHFNPVDIVCCLRNWEGKKFDLPAYVDEDTGLISSKSYQGRDLKALELPGLWNGSMSDWNTLFVEVPLETFNPVKVVLDLLRPAHQI